jgi:hypothetical protein
MVLYLGEQLDVPLRERNELLLAAGYAPLYSRSEVDAPRMAAVRSAVREILAGHEPYPAVVVDRGWNIVDANASIGLFTEGLPDQLLTAPANALRISLHPDGMAPRIVNLGVWRSHLLGRLRRQVSFTGDPDLAALYQELRAYPCDQPEPEIELPGPADVVIPLRLRHGDREIAFLSTVATFGTPLDITVAELAIESFFPADAETAGILQARTER